AQLRAGPRRSFPGGGVDPPDPAADSRTRAVSAGRGACFRQPRLWLLPRLPDLLPARAPGSFEAVVSAQLWALAVAGAVVLAAACLETVRSRRARRLVLGSGPILAFGGASPQAGKSQHPTNGEDTAPYILYFTGDSCTVC